MRLSKVGRTNRTRMVLLSFLAVIGGPEPARTQTQASEVIRQGYFRAVGEFFAVPSSELEILNEWQLDADEIPVVLFIAERAGVSPEALVALRRSGRNWAELATRYGVNAAVLHVPIPEQSSAGKIAPLYRQYRSIPESGWADIQLEPAEIIALVNVRLLAQTLGISPAEVLAQSEAVDSFVKLFGELIH
ncbi:MAG TPA: hypothetical protein EYN99_07975 [Gemmatimonadetes bacterium]|nr:hypothetical protein [Gemmatimonadota bacterium]HIN77871.1 hypothetical protein [Gemmatimonadota bacterium]